MPLHPLPLNVLHLLAVSFVVALLPIIVVDRCCVVAQCDCMMDGHCNHRSIKDKQRIGIRVAKAIYFYIYTCRKNTLLIW